MFRFAALLLTLPSLILLGGGVAYYFYFPPESFTVPFSDPPKSSSYQRYGVKKEIYLSDGDQWTVGCEEALLVAPRKGFGEWTENWNDVKGKWGDKIFTADEASFFFSNRRLEASHLTLRGEGDLEVIAGKGEFNLLSSPPTCLLKGGIVGKGTREGTPFDFNTPSLLVLGDKLTSFGDHTFNTLKGNFFGKGLLEIELKKEGGPYLHQIGGGIFKALDGWEAPFEGELFFKDNLLTLPKGKIVLESEHYSVEGHALKADLKEGKLTDIELSKNVTLLNRLTKLGEPIQQGTADKLNIFLPTKDALLSGRKKQRALFVDNTHGVKMEVDALYFRFDEKGEIDGIEGRGEMNVSTLKQVSKPTKKSALKGNKR